MNSNVERPSYFAVIPANVRYDKSLRANEKLLYGEISALTNKTGECWASNKYFADLYGVTTQAVSKWILNLKNRGYVKIVYIYKHGTKEIDKRIIKMVSTNVSEVSTNVSEVSTNDYEGINNGLQGYQQKIKENNIKYNNTSNNNTNNKSVSASQTEKEFETLWSAYPRKQGKAAALKAYTKARKSGVEFQTVLDGVYLYAAYLKRNKVEDRFIKQGSTWFNQQCWNDEYKGGSKPIEHDAELDEIF